MIWGICLVFLKNHVGQSYEPWRTMKKQPLVSIIIATKNEEKHIAPCLRSLQQQSYPHLEIMVVDNRSNDRTVEIAKRHTSKVYLLPQHKDIKNFRGAQVNLGVKKAHGEIIFFPDADMTFSKNLIAEAVHLMQKYDALYVPEIVLGKGFFGKVRNFERSFYHNTVIDAVRFVRKEIFLSIGGFDEKRIEFGPDDWDLTKMIKKKTTAISHTSSYLYHHEEGLSLSVYLNKKKKYTTTFANYSAKWGKKDPDVKKQLGFSYRLFGVFFEKGKYKRLLMHPVLALSLYYLRIRVGIHFLFT